MNQPPNPWAFPLLEEGPHSNEGMSLRDYFAAHVLPATADRAHIHGMSAIAVGSPMHAALAAKAAYAFADAMLAERSKATGAVA